MREIRPVLMMVVMLAAAPAAAQTTAPGAPAAPDQSAHPCAPQSRAPGQETLSDKLDDCNGVIRPSVGMDPGIAQPAPDPRPGDMPVIKPSPDAQAK
jgi:hypothetical protein